MKKYFKAYWTQKPKREGAPRHYGLHYCSLMNVIDFRFWFCDCEYTPPYGKVIMGGCPKHD